MTALDVFLRGGHDAGLFTAATAGISTPSGSEIVSLGTLAQDDPTPATDSTLFDLASLTKTFTAAALVRLVERGVLDLDAPISSLLRVSRGPGTNSISLRMLLTHTSGLPAGSSLWHDAAMPAAHRRDAALAATLAFLPDTTFHYSCLGYITAASVAEHVTGKSLDELIRDLVTAPLRLDSIRFGPCDPAVTAATEQQDYAERGMVRGTVHDELSWYLGGVTGNAGLFGTAGDVLRFAQSFLDGSLLGAEGLRLMTTPALRPDHGAEFQHSLGLRINDPGFLGKHEGYGHTGFTGTSWLVVPERQTAAVLLTNRVHPHRDRVDLRAFRQQFADLVADS